MQDVQCFTPFFTIVYEYIESGVKGAPGSVQRRFNQELAMLFYCRLKEGEFFPSSNVFIQKKDAYTAAYLLMLYKNI